MLGRFLSAEETFGLTSSFRGKGQVLLDGSDLINCGLSDKAKASPCGLFLKEPGLLNALISSTQIFAKRTQGGLGGYAPQKTDKKIKVVLR
jgi:hypothetical protein